MEKELHEFLTESPSERLEGRVRRMVGQGSMPVRLCMGRRSGETRFLHMTAELMEPGTEDEALRRLRELMEQAITERVQGVEWASELTPTTLRKVMQAMRPLRVMPLEQDPLKRLFLRMAMSDQQMLGHNAFVTVTEPLELSDEIKVELPAETMRKYLDALGVKGDS